ncbi:MAG: hypothetical protein J0I06_04910 [Planctomycetes bacterium]|nr:hypothetical protein [Planctomycetota bacterium]
MRRLSLLVLVFTVGTASGWLLNSAAARQHRPARTAPNVRAPEYITIGRPEPTSPSGRAWHTLRVVPTVDLQPGETLTDEWVVTLLTDDIGSGGGVRSVSFTAR